MTKQKEEKVVEEKGNDVVETGAEVATWKKGEDALSTETAPSAFDDGLGEITADDLIIPRLIVSQDQHKLPAEQTGKLYCDVTGDASEKMTMAIIKLTKSRILFPATYKKDNEPLCRSHNFTHPADDIDGAKAMCTDCESCEYSKWSADAPPRCQECWNLLVVDLESYMPMWFTVKSKSLKPTRKIVSALKMRTGAKRIPVWGISFDVRVEVSPGDSGDSYIPVFSGLAELSADERETMNIIHGQLVNEHVKDLPEGVKPEETPAGDF